MSTSIYSLTSKRFSSCIFLITLSLWSKGYINVASNRTRQCVLHSPTSNTMAVCLSRARLLDRWKRWKTSGVFPVCNCLELRASGGTRDSEINFGKQFAALVFGRVTNARYVCTHTRTHSRTHSYTHEHTHRWYSHQLICNFIGCSQKPDILWKRKIWLIFRKLKINTNLSYRSEDGTVSVRTSQPGWISLSQGAGWPGGRETSNELIIAEKTPRAITLMNRLYPLALVSRGSVWKRSTLRRERFSNITIINIGKWNLPGEQ